MSRYVEGEHKDQLNMLPMSLNEMIPEDHPVRVIDAFVDSLDMNKLQFKHSNPKGMGRKPYNPRHLLKLYMYGYLNGIRTTRKLEREAHRNIEVMWLLDQLKPDDRTISGFRQENPEALKGVFREFSLLCSELGLYGKQMIAVDGSKFRASNSRHKSFTKRKVKRMLEHYEESASRYLELLEANEKQDVREDDEKTVSLKEKLERAQNRIKELEKMAEEIEKNGEISVTDPDARHMSVSNNGTDISHNVQIAVDDKHHLVVAVDVVSTPADQQQLHGMAKQAMQEMGVEKDPETGESLTVLADKGYYNGEEFCKCKEDGMNLIVSKQKYKTPFGDEEYSKEYFTYDQEKDQYICPEGKILYNTSRKDSIEKVYKNSKECKSCEVRDRCTKNLRGRMIRRRIHDDLCDEVDQQTKENMDLYKQRQMIVEHPFATVKRNLGYTYFLTRGNTNVKAESFMHFFTYNFIRVMNIVDRKELIELLRDRKERLFCFVYRMLYFGKNQSEEFVI